MELLQSCTKPSISWVSNKTITLHSQVPFITWFNSLASERCGGKCIVQTHFKNYVLSTSCEICLRWVLQNPINDNSTLVQEIAWYHQATSHHLSQCWPRSMLPYVGHNELIRHGMAHRKTMTKVDQKDNRGHTLRSQMVPCVSVLTKSYGVAVVSTVECHYNPVQYSEILH